MARALNERFYDLFWIFSDCFSFFLDIEKNVSLLHCSGERLKCTYVFYWNFYSCAMCRCGESRLNGNFLSDRAPAYLNGLFSE